MECFEKEIIPWAWGGAITRYNRLVPDGEVRVEDVQRVTAAVGLRVWTGKHASQHEQFTAEHAATVVRQGWYFPLSLRKTREDDIMGSLGGGGVGSDFKQGSYLHHGPPPALSVQYVNIIEPLLLLRASEYKDLPGVRVVHSRVANPGLGRRPLRQSLCCHPGHVLCRTETKALALRWVLKRRLHGAVSSSDWPVHSFHKGSLQICILAPWPPIRIAVWASMGHRVWPQRLDGPTVGAAGNLKITIIIFLKPVPSFIYWNPI